MGEGGRQVAGKRATAPNSLPGIEQAAAPTSRAQVSYWAHAYTHLPFLYTSSVEKPMFCSLAGERRQSSVRTSELEKHMFCEDFRNCYKSSSNLLFLVAGTNFMF